MSPHRKDIYKGVSQNLNKIIDFFSEDNAQYELIVEPAEGEHQLMKIGKYTIIEELGKGGAGVVYKAHDPDLKRYVALKILTKALPDDIERFKKEAIYVANMRHPNIAQVYEIGEIDNKRYISMELIEGTNLEKLIGALSIEELVKIMIKVCDALELAHKNGIIHRDLKPQNIMVSRDGNVFLVDFSIAKDLYSYATVTRDLVGTPQFMSPEQIRGTEMDERSDIYSLGATLYRCVTENDPFMGTSAIDICARILDEEPINMKALKRKTPPELALIINKALYKNKELRYQNAPEFKDDLTRFLEGEAIRAKKPSIAYLIRKKITRHKNAVMLVLLAVLMTFAGSYFLLDKFSPPGFTNDGKEPTELNMNSAGLYLDKARAKLDKVEHSTQTEIRGQIQDILKEGIKLTSEAIESNNGYYEAHTLKSRFLTRMGRYQSAEKNLTRAIKDNHDYNEAYYFRIMSICERIIRNPYGVMLEGERSRLINQSRSDLEQLARLQVNRSQYEHAEAMVKIIETSNENPDVRTEELIIFLDNVIELNSSLAHAYGLRGKLRIDRLSIMTDDKKIERTIELAYDDFRKALLHDSNNDFYYYTCANLLKKRGEFAEALSYIDTAIEINPGECLYLLQKATILIATGNKALAWGSVEGASLLKETVRNAGKLIDYHVNAAIVKSQLGDPEGSVRDMEKAFQLAKGNKEVISLLEFWSKYLDDNTD